MLKLILIVFTSWISLSNACSCYLPEGWQKEAYCKANFAGTIKVTGPSYNCGGMQICYPITVVDQYRGAPATITVAKTANNSAACGITLTPGHIYFVAAFPDTTNTNIIGVGLCQLVEDWSVLTNDERKKKEKEYKGIKCPGDPVDPVDPDCGHIDLKNLVNLLRELLAKLRNCGDNHKSCCH